MVVVPACPSWGCATRDLAMFGSFERSESQLHGGYLPKLFPLPMPSTRNTWHQVLYLESPQGSPFPEPSRALFDISQAD